MAPKKSKVAKKAKNNTPNPASGKNAKRVTAEQGTLILGGGVSGLVNAYAGTKRGEPTTLIDTKDKLGGMIHTIQTPYGLVEKAANGLLNSYAVEQLIHELGLKATYHTKAAKRRFFYVGGNWKRLPLPIPSLVRTAYRAFTKNAQPLNPENMLQWASRVLGEDTAKFLIEPALGGIYASPLELMDPRMVFSMIDFSRPGSLVSRARASRKKKPKPTVRGLISFAGGMQELVDGLVDAVGSKIDLRLGAKPFRLSEFRKDNSWSEVKICLPIQSVYKLLQEDSFTKPFLETFSLAEPKLYSVATLTRFSKDPLFPKPAFGGLFPRGEGVRANGVLSNDSIFPGRTIEPGLFSETWIYSGDFLKTTSESQLREILEEDRAVATGRRTDPVAKDAVFSTIWLDAFPIYGQELWDFNLCLDAIEQESAKQGKPIRFYGNYRRGIGLRSLIEAGLE